jgi:hypothetical protein
LAAFVGNVIACLGLPCRLWPIAVRESPDGTSGSQTNRWKKHGMDRQGILRTALAAVESGDMSTGLAALDAVHLSRELVPRS